MKVTYYEEIEERKAWRKNMLCPQCGEPIYKIHHQLLPETSSAWWLECPNCEFEGPTGPTKEIAIARWKQC